MVHCTRCDRPCRRPNSKSAPRRCVSRRSRRGSRPLRAKRRTPRWDAHLTKRRHRVRVLCRRLPIHVDQDSHDASASRGRIVARVRPSVSAAQRPSRMSGRLPESAPQRSTVAASDATQDVARCGRHRACATRRAPSEWTAVAPARSLPKRSASVESARPQTRTWLPVASSARKRAECGNRSRHYLTV